MHTRLQRIPAALAFAAAVGALGALGACSSSAPPTIANADARRGAGDIANVGCGACHQISGIPGASGMVGPPLDNVGRRGIIGGELPNTPENMVRWIRDPQSVNPNTAMPNLHLSEQSARDIAAYLYSLR